MEEAQSSEIEHQLHLPHDLVAEHILTRLPAKSLIKFKPVSKQWYSTLSSHQFAYSHLKLSPFCHPISQNQYLFIQNRSDYYMFSYSDEFDDDVDEMGNVVVDGNMNLVKLRFDFDDDDLVLIGSCNGLVCLASFGCFFFILWNPMTGKHCKYCDPDLVIDSSCNYRVSWGFGYVSSLDDYKVVRILELNGAQEIRTHVFSLNSNKWTRIYSTPYEHEMMEVHGDTSRYPYSFHTRQGVFVDETLYWIGSEMDSCGRRIIAFDLAREMFDTINDVESVSNDAWWVKFLCVVGGCLWKCGINNRNILIIRLKGPGEMEYLRLPKDLGLQSCQAIVGCTRKGKFFVLVDHSTIGIVDPTSQPMKYTPLVTIESLGKSRVGSYIPTLISPSSAV